MHVWLQSIPLVSILRYLSLRRGLMRSLRKRCSRFGVISPNHNFTIIAWWRFYAWQSDALVNP